MKKIVSLTLAVIMIFSLSSCLSSDFGKDLLTLENVETLDTKSFVLTDILIRTDFHLTEKSQALNILKKIPVDEIQTDLMDNYGITLDTSLFPKQLLDDSNVGTYVTDKGQATGLWTWQHKTEEKMQSASMMVVINLYNQTNPMFLSVSTSLYDSTGKKLTHVYGEENWASGHTTADKNTAAIVKFKKHISPDYIQTKNGIETYESYYQKNASLDGGIYVDTTYPVKISATVDDPGVFMLVEGVTFYDAIINETYEPNKTYIIEYKVNRDTFSKYNWKVEFSKKEN